jgi:hypothetical protein
MAAVLAIGAALLGCPNPVCKFRGTINQPENLSMRRSLLRKGMGDVCKQMLERSAPLRLTPDSPVIGRFFPQQCVANEQDENLHLQFSGIGYGWTNVSKKMTFTASASALYRYDFRVREEGDCDIYAYFRPSRIDASDFKVHRIEGTAANVFNAFTNMGETFGRQLVGKKLQEGFTVVSYDAKETNVDFALGIVPVGQPIPHPYQTRGGERATYESERVEVHQNQREFVGPVPVEGSGRAIFVTVQVDGAPAVDVLLMRKEEGDASLRLYFEYPQAGPLAAVPLGGDVAQQGQELRRAFAVGPGMYYVVFDNTPSAGQVSPPMNSFDDRAAVVSYLIQVGDAS